jgi:hypothetical protein
MEIMDLDTLKRNDLLEHWRALFGKPPPRGLSSAFLRRFIAFETQVRTRGGLPKDFLRKLSRQASGKGVARTPALRPGSRLLREWNGVTHVVDVHEDGFTRNGRTHRSLSAIAREITGARWSGPRFFGLNGKARS